MNIDYNERIPNNVDLADDRRLLRALEHWQPAYLKWWDDMGPVDSGDMDVYLRTAISAGGAAGRASAYPVRERPASPARAMPPVRIFRSTSSR